MEVECRADDDWEWPDGHQAPHPLLVVADAVEQLQSGEHPLRGNQEGVQQLSEQEEHNACGRGNTNFEERTKIVQQKK